MRQRGDRVWGRASAAFWDEIARGATSEDAGVMAGTSGLEDGVRERLFLRKESDATRDHPVRMRAQEFRGVGTPRGKCATDITSSEPKTMVSLAQ
jgi:hypothetical protein